MQSDLISLQASDQGAHTSRSPWLQPSRTGFVSLFGPPRCLGLPSFSLYFSRHLKDAPRFSLLIFHFPFPPSGGSAFVNLNCFSLMNARSNRRNQTIRDRRLMGVNSKMNLKGLSLRGRGVDPPPLNAPPSSKEEWNEM